MIVAPTSSKTPYRRMTRHKFATHLLSGTSDSEIAWWNPLDHSEQIPWRINRSFYTRVNQHLNHFNYTYHSGDPALVTPVLELWGVDSSGAEKIIILESPSTYNASSTTGAAGGTSHNDTLHVCGVKWKLYAPSYTYSYQVGDPSCLMWSYKNKDQTLEISTPLR